MRFLAHAHPPSPRGTLGQRARAFGAGVVQFDAGENHCLTFPLLESLGALSHDRFKWFFHMSDHHHHLFNTQFIWLKLVTAAYVAAIPLTHGFLPHSWVWELALFFLVAMLFTYPAAAIASGKFVQLEVGISPGLITLGIVGYFTNPLLLIAAILGHGVWDFFKHRGAGVRFFRWYVIGCYTVEWTYAAALLFFYLNGAIG